MEEIKKIQNKKPKNRNEDSSSSSGSSSLSSDSDKKASKKKRDKKPSNGPGKNQRLLATQVDQLLPESMVIDNKITGETKKKPPRDYSPEDDGTEEVPEQAVILEEPTLDKKQKT